MTNWSIEDLQGRSSFQDWQELFDRLAPPFVGEICADAMRQTLGVPEALNFYSAGICRLRDMANLAVALTDAQRESCIKLADGIVHYVEARFAAFPEKLERLHVALSTSDEFYRVWGDMRVPGDRDHLFRLIATSRSD